jgi:uncharacterized protein YndB with AHSA1/START domain
MTNSPVSPGGGRPPAKPAPPKQPSVVVLADAKITVQAPIPRVFEALVNPEQLSLWWAQDVEVEAEESGRYEGTTPEGRVEGTITAIDGPGRLSYTWPIAREGGPIETSVAYELTPKGPATFVRLLHRSPQPVPGDWNDQWHRALESLKGLLEGEAPASE